MSRRLSYTYSSVHMLWQHGSIASEIKPLCSVLCDAVCVSGEGLCVIAGVAVLCDGWSCACASIYLWYVQEIQAAC